MKGYQRTIYVGLIIIAISIVLKSQIDGSIGTVLMSVGSLFFISGMSKKRKENGKNGGKKDEEV